MKKVFSRMIEKYHYDSEEERNNHVIEMEKLGWYCTGQLREFKGNLMLDSTKDNENYVWFAEFYK